MPKSKSVRRPRQRPPSPPAALPQTRRQPWLLGGLGVAVIVTLVAAYFLWPTNVPPSSLGALASGLVTRVESLYNDISVYKATDGKLTLTFGAKRLNYIESIVNPADELDLPVYYTQSMTAGLAYAAGLDDAMIIGLGGGRTAWYHHKSVPAMHMTAVELDPEVMRLAGQYFSVRPERNFDIVNEDGRVFLSGTRQHFDIILVDAYRGPFVPFHLLTTEFYKLVAAHLKPGGVAVQNVEPSTMLFDSAVATIRSAFDHVVFLEGHGNIIVVAYNGPERDEAALRKTAAERQAMYGLRYDLNAILDRRFTPAWNAATKPLTDDFAPVEYLKAIERHNQKQS